MLPTATGTDKVTLTTQQLDALRKTADQHRVTASTLPRDSEVAKLLRDVSALLDEICEKRNHHAKL
jgi:hypothetical protein